MNKLIMATLLATLAAGAVGCRENYEDYDTQATVWLETPDSIAVEKMQGTVTLRNLSNGYKYAASDIRQSAVSFSLLRGAYALDAEGSLVFTYKNDKTGRRHVGYFRATENYVEVVQHPAVVRTKIVMM